MKSVTCQIHFPEPIANLLDQHARELGFSGRSTDMIQKDLAVLSDEDLGSFDYFRDRFVLGESVVAKKMKDIQAACRNIVALWPTITADD